jgi:hypothetical protein
MILPWAHRLISAGAHGLRRIPGQSVNLAHLIWRTPRAPAPLLLKEATRRTPGGFPRGAKGVGMIIHYSFPATKLPTSLDPLRGRVYHARLAEAVTHRFEETARA